MVHMSKECRWIKKPLVYELNLKHGLKKDYMVKSIKIELSWKRMATKKGFVDHAFDSSFALEFCFDLNLTVVRNSNFPSPTHQISAFYQFELNQKKEKILIQNLIIHKPVRPTSRLSMFVYQPDRRITPGEKILLSWKSRVSGVTRSRSAFVQIRRFRAIIGLLQA